MNVFSDFSLWILIPSFLFALLISLWYYTKGAKNESFSVRQKFVLIAFRTLGIFLLCLLLVGLIWETLSYRQEKPLIITLIDRSESMLNYSDSGRVNNELSAFSKDLQKQYEDQFEFEAIDFGQQVRKTTSSDKFSDEVTDMAEAIQYTRDHYFNRNIGAVVLVSDGNYNRGVHPMYESERMELVPFFGLGVGDTVTKKDVVVKSITSNDIAFINNEFPIQSIIAFHKMPLGTVSVGLFEGGKQIQTKQVQITNSNYDLKEVVFNLEAKKKGFHRYSVQVAVQRNEFSSENNQKSCFVEIIDTKSNVVLLASGPHPDIAAIKSVLELDKQRVVESKLTSEFKLTGALPDLIVLYENGIQGNPTLLKQCLEKKIPVFLILGPNVNTGNFQNWGLPVRAPSRTQFEDVYPSLSKGFKLIEFTQEVKEFIPKCPPLKTRFGNFGLPANAIPVITQRVAGIEKNDPLLIFMETNQTKVGMLFGEGIWRWKMKEFSLKKKTPGFDEFVQKIAQYLTVKQNKEPLRITLPKTFNSIEDIIIKAEFYNQSMELITSPKLVFEVTRQGGKKYTQNFAPTYNFYESNLGQLEAGLYRWKAEAIHEGKHYVKSGEFAVEGISLEKQESRANWSTMTQLASQSDGAFFPLKEYKKLLKTLETRSDIATVQYSDTGYTSIIDSWWYFALLIVVFGLEWFFRRFWGAY